MIIYRPHKGDLNESMKNCKEFNDEAEMKEFIVKEWGNVFTIDDIIIDTMKVTDDRIGWTDTQYVCVKKIGEKINNIPQCIGMCATNYKNK